MALFLVTCVVDEGVYESSFRVIQASSRESVATYILNHYASWEDFILSSIFYLWLEDQAEGPTELWEKMKHVIGNEEERNQLRQAFKPWFLNLSPQTLLKWIDRTSVDGDSRAQLAIYAIKEIEQDG